MRTILYCVMLLCSFLTASGYRMNPNTHNAMNCFKSGDITSAIEALKKAFATNDVIAQYYMAQCYEYGIGFEINHGTAFSLYRRAAERGFPPAMQELARCYQHGIGVQQNNARANEWYNRFNAKHFSGSIPNIVDIYNSLGNTEQLITQSEENNPHKAIVKSHEASYNKTPESAIVSQSMNVSLNKKPTKHNISDVDANIPCTGNYSENIFALIIANENYQDVMQVENALNDGEIMAQYCQKTLGIPNSNIHLVKDATLNNIKREVNLMRQIADAYDGKASFIIYYAGHGIPDEKTNQAYLMPIDGFSSDLTTCYSISDFYNAFGDIPTQQTIIFIDACFSGSARGDEMLYAARGVKIKAKPGTPTGNTVVISSAQGDETAYPYSEQNHGLFTYFILKKLKESNGDITLGALFDYVKDNVRKKSLVANGKSQTPMVTSAREINDVWHDWKLK